MIRTNTHFACFLLINSLMAIPGVSAQSLDTPMTRLRPIGTPSAVDQYLAPSASSEPARFRETAFQQQGAYPEQGAFQQQGQVRQAAMLQQMQAPQLPNSGQPPANYSLPQSGPNFAPPPNNAPSVLVPQAAVPRGLPNPGYPTNPGLPSNLVPVPLNQAGPIPSSSDRSPVAPPQLHDGFATINDCNCISAPSSYTAASGVGGCAPVSYLAPQAYVAPPAEIAAPAILPSGTVAPQTIGVPASPLVSFGQRALPLQIGRGLFGQPVAYVQGQRVRNWFRYIFP